MSAAGREREDDTGAAGAAGAAGGVRRDYGTIVVVGGGCYGSYYVRQLARARDAGALRYERLLVVDRDPGCRVARARAGAAAGATAGPAPGGPPQLQDTPDIGVAPHHFAAIDVEIAEWDAFFRRYLGGALDAPGSCRADAIVPSPLMPHLVYDWLLERARARWPERTVRTVPLDREPSTPWQRGAADGTHYVSFAEWMCPINCVEPALCPEIRGPRTWSMPAAVRAYVDAERGRGTPLSGPLLLHCVHRAYGVGMFDTADVLAADAALTRLAAEGSARVLVGTVSHCHGALNVLEVGGRG